MLNLLIICLIIILLLVINNIKENFYNNNIGFISIKDTCKILKNIDYNYNYLDIKLRFISNHYHNDIYKFYCDNLLDFNDLDKKLLLWVINAMKKRIPEKFLFIFKNIKIAKFKDNVDNGYPHTNKNIIFLSESFIYSILEYYNKNDENNCIKNIGAIIIHECIHIWQRKDSKDFYDLYTNYWNFIKVEKIYNSEKLDKIKRFNPDGPDTNWIFNFKGKYILFLSIYNNNAKNIGDVKCVGIYLEKMNNSYIVPDNSKRNELINLKEFNYFFEHLYGNHYHPNEISAELLSIYYLKIMTISHKEYTNIAYKNMLVWFNKIINNK